MSKNTVLALSLVLIPISASAYYGRNSTEATLTFEAQADVVLNGAPSVAALNREGAARSRALEKIDEQVQHLMGTFQSKSFQDEFGYPGVLGEKYEIRFTSVQDGSEKGRKLLGYEFEGKVVFHKGAFKGSATRKVPLKLPLSPDLIYAKGMVGHENKCTDEHYNSEGDFWYFWDPDQKGCPLKGDEQDVLRVEGKLEKLPNTTLTYPEYDRLYGDNGNGEKIDIAVFIGYIDDIASLSKPNTKDDAYVEMTGFEKQLTDWGMTLTEKKDSFREYANGATVKGINFLRRYELGNVRLTILLADTAIDSHDETFHRYLRGAFHDADVLVYDGHSGLGGNLDISTLEGITFDPKKYQIFFFNGCSSYPYYNRKFFDAKGGSKNLDIITSGLETYSNTGGPNLIAFLQDFVQQKEISYQRILQDLERSNADMGTYLVGVNGDEDNKYRP